MGTAPWDHDAFYRELISRAKALGIANATPELAAALKPYGITHSMLSKWYRGHERPSPKSLQKLSDALTLPTERAEGKTAYPVLMVLAGHLQPYEVGMAEPPTPPVAVERDPHVVELEQLLSPTSHLDEAQRNLLRGFVDQALAGFRQNRRRKRTA